MCVCVSVKESVSLDYGTIKQLYAKIKKKKKEEEVLDETLQAPKKKKHMEKHTHTEDRMGSNEVGRRGLLSDMKINTA